MIEIETDPAMGDRERVEIENGSKYVFLHFQITYYIVLRAVCMGPFL